MATMSGLGTTYNLPNYTGQVYRITPSETPFLAMMGEINGEGKATTSTVFEWQTSSLAAAIAQPSIVEGAAPAYAAYVRANVSNVVQIFQHGFDLSYSKIAAINRLAGVGIGERNPITDEIAYQTEQYLADIAREMEFTFLRGEYHLPSDNTTARRSRGVRTAVEAAGDTMITLGAPLPALTFTASSADIASTAHGLAVNDVVVFTALPAGMTALVADQAYYVVAVPNANTFQVASARGGAAIVVNAGGGGSGTGRTAPALTRQHVLDLLQRVYDYRGINTNAAPTIFVNATLKRALSKIFVSDAGYREMTRNVGGVNVTDIETDFGRVSVVLNRYVANHELLFVHVGVCTPVYLLVPGKGFLFLEELAQTGASVKYQIYGEAGLEYGDARMHGLIRYAGMPVGA